MARSHLDVDSGRRRTAAGNTPLDNGQRMLAGFDLAPERTGRAEFRDGFDTGAGHGAGFPEDDATVVNGADQRREVRVSRQTARRGGRGPGSLERHPVNGRRFGGLSLIGQGRPKDHRHRHCRQGAGDSADPARPPRSRTRFLRAMHDLAAASV